RRRPRSRRRSVAPGGVPSWSRSSLPSNHLTVRATPYLSNASLREQRLRARQLRSLAVRLLTERGELSGVRPGFRAVTRELGGARGASQPPEAVRLDAHRGLELLERLRGLVGLEQHLGQELTGRGERPRGDRVLLRRALALGRRAQQGQRLIILAFGPRHPG